MRAFCAVLLAALAVLGGGCGGNGEEGSGEKNVLRIVIGSEPPSLDSTLLTDVISANIVQNIMDPLVRLDEELEPEAALAESWDVSDDGKTVTFHLREDGRWTNGDPVTAGDFEYAWKRILDPELAAGYAYQLHGIVGAAEYNGCKEDCGALRDKVGVRAVDERTLEVRLTGAQPWFIAQAAHASFLPLHRATVERHGKKWTEPRNIVTNGPFRLTGWKHDDSMTLRRWEDWRGAGDVSLERIEVRIITDPTTALAAFEAGEVDACMEGSCTPPAEIERLQASDVYVSRPGLATSYVGVNVKTIPDIDQRRALAFALDRQSIVDNVTKAGEKPATTFTPDGMPGYDLIEQDFLPTTAELDKAREFLGRASSPKRELNLVFTSDDPVGRDLAVAIQAMWKEIGIDVSVRGLEWQSLLELLGPPLDPSVDVYLLGWAGDYVDGINFLELWTCDGGNNISGYCDPAYDRLIDEARRTPDDAARHELYAQAEAKLTGPEGALPIIPSHWSVFLATRRAGIEGWEPNLLAQYDFTEVTLPEE